MKQQLMNSGMRSDFRTAPILATSCIFQTSTAANHAHYQITTAKE